MSQCVWELLSIEKSFSTKCDKCETDPTYDSSHHFECHNARSADIRSEKIDYDYAEELSHNCKKKNEKDKLKFEKIMHKFFISDISKYVKAYVKKNDSNIRSEIGITSSKGTNSEEERNWVNSYIYNFISYCLMTYNDCKHYIVITSTRNLIQKLTGTGYGYYGIYFTNGKKIGGMGNLFIKINQVRHISYSIMKTLQTRPASDRSMSNNDETSSFTFAL